MSPALSERVLAWQRGGQWMDWQGHRVFYRQAGSGPVLLLVHGYPVGSYDWHAVWPELSKHFTLIAPDMLGHGFSAKPMQGDYSLSKHAQLHNALLLQLGVARCRVMGFDLGVSVVQEMLAQRLEKPGLPKIDAVVLLNGGVCPDAYQPRLIQRLMLTRLGPWLAPRVPQSTFAKTIIRMYQCNGAAPSAELLDDFWVLFCELQGQAVAHRVGAFWHERKALSHRLLGALVNSPIALRLINGSADPNSGEHMMKAFFQHAPNADVVGLPGIGHWPQIQAPQEVLRASLAFFQTGLQET